MFQKVLSDTSRIPHLWPPSLWMLLASSSASVSFLQSLLHMRGNGVSHACFLDKVLLPEPGYVASPAWPGTLWPPPHRAHHAVLSPAATALEGQSHLVKEQVVLFWHLKSIDIPWPGIEHSDMPGLQVQSPVMAHTGINQLVLQ